MLHPHKGYQVPHDLSILLPLRHDVITLSSLPPVSQPPWEIVEHDCHAPASALCPLPEIVFLKICTELTTSLLLVIHVYIFLGTLFKLHALPFVHQDTSTLLVLFCFSLAHRVVSPSSWGDTFLDAQWMPETMDYTKTIIYYVFFSIQPYL